MRLSQLDVTDVRNLASVHVALKPGLNCFYGGNGAGKSALLEAIHFLSRGRSFRPGSYGALIGKSAQELLVRCQLDDPAGTRMGIRRGRDGATELRIRGERQRKLSAAARLLPVHLILPNVSDLVFSNPGLRRQIVDWGVFHVEHGYTGELRDFDRIHKQRNSTLLALKKSGMGGTTIPGTLTAWNEQYVQAAEAVENARQRYLSALAPHFEAAMDDLAPGIGVTFGWDPGWNTDQSLEKLLSESFAHEVKLAATRWGPHRANLRFHHEGRVAKSSLSRGQGKIAAVGFLLSQARLLMASNAQPSVFLIDDFGSELDQDHNRRLLVALKKLDVQVIATATDPTLARSGIWTNDEMAVFHVKHGQVYEDQE